MALESSPRKKIPGLTPGLQTNGIPNAYHGRLKEWLRRLHGVATKNLPNYLGWRRTLKALGPNATPADLILGPIGLGPYQQTAVQAPFLLDVGRQRMLKQQTVDLSPSSHSMQARVPEPIANGWKAD